VGRVEPKLQLIPVLVEVELAIMPMVVVVVMEPMLLVALVAMLVAAMEAMPLSMQQVEQVRSLVVVDLVVVPATNLVGMVLVAW